MRPMIATYHGDDMLGHRADDGSIPVLGEVRAALVRWHAHLFTATVAQSGEMHRRLRPRVRRRNTVIRCGVDAEQFSPMDREEARSRLGWDRGERIALFAATRPYDALKRLDLARGAVAHAEAELGPIRLVVAENVPPDSMPVMMSAADCLLLTSMSEGSPMVVKEAMLCTLPVVATDVGDVRELLEGVSPSAVCRHDPAELGVALADVLRANRRSNGRAQWAELDQATTVQRLLALYGDFGVGPGVRSAGRLVSTLAR
jgi:glycosyltransferase involved in cell wall biosynthesis